MRRDHGFHASATSRCCVASVIGGIAARHDVTLEALDDLQLALGSVLEHDETDDGEINVLLQVGAKAIDVSVGPIGERTVAEFEGDAGDALGLRRLLDTTVDHATLSERDGARLGQSAQGFRAGRLGGMTRISDKILLRRYHEQGDLAAREQLIEQYLSLVRSLARRYAYRGEQLDDLVQIGCIGLIKAIDRFDIDRGVGSPRTRRRTSSARSSATSATRAGPCASRAASRS